MGLFGAIGRETKGAFRSLGYDLRRSKRFRRIGVIAVATVAGGVIATGALVRGEPVPGLPGLGDADGSDIVRGWFGGSDTTGQDAESSEAESASLGSAEPSESESPAGSTSQDHGPGTGGRSPDLVPIGGDETSGSGEEESSPTAGPTAEPTDGPTSGGPTEEPTTAAPSTGEPSESASASGSPSLPLSEQVSRSSSVAPMPRKGPVGG